RSDPPGGGLDIVQDMKKEPSPSSTTGKDHSRSHDSSAERSAGLRVDLVTAIGWNTPEEEPRDAIRLLGPRSCGRSWVAPWRYRSRRMFILVSCTSAFQPE